MEVEHAVDDRGLPRWGQLRSRIPQVAIVRAIGAVGSAAAVLFAASDEALVGRFPAVAIIAVSAALSTLTSLTGVADRRATAHVVRAHVGLDLANMLIVVAVIDPAMDTGAWTLLLVPIGEAALIAIDRDTTVWASAGALVGMGVTMFVANGVSLETLGRWGVLVFLAGGPTSVFLVQAVRVQRALWKANDARERLHDLATRDELTGLLNRRGLAASVDERDGLRALVFVDLDGFKSINDTLGHDAGDDVLRAVARRLEVVVDGVGEIARLGGDEFAIALSSSSDVDRITASLRARVALPIEVRGTDVRVGASVGVSRREVHARGQLLQMIDEADAAMYLDKARRSAAAPERVPA